MNRPLCSGLVLACLAGVFPGMQIPVGAGELASASAGDEIPDWQARLELARILSYTKKYDESVREYRKVIKEKPDVPAFRAELANVLIWQGKREEALLLLKDLPVEQLEAKTRLAFVDLLVADKQYPQAIQLLQEHLASASDDQAARLKLADVLSWNKSYDASIAEYRHLLKARPQDAQVRRRLANVLLWADRKTEAAEELRKSLGNKE